MKYPSLSTYCCTWLATVSRWVVLEAEQDPAKADPERYAALGYRHLRSLLAEASLL